MTEPKWLSAQELGAWRALALMQLQLQAHLSRGLLVHGLSFQDYLVLASLSDRSDGRCRVVELSHELGWEKSRLSHHISRMCQRTLVSKLPCPSDQRGTFIVITREGRRQLAAAAPDHVADVRRLFFSVVRPSEVKVIARVASRVLENLDVVEEEFSDVSKARIGDEPGIKLPTP